MKLRKNSRNNFVKVHYNSLKTKEVIIIKKNKKIIHLFLFISIIILNIFLIKNISKSNLNGKFDPTTIESNYNDNKELTKHTRYISDETIESLNENSKWVKDENLNEKLKETLEKNPEEIEGYEIKKD